MFASHQLSPFLLIFQFALYLLPILGIICLIVYSYRKQTKSAIDSLEQQYYPDHTIDASLINDKNRHIDQ